jgi:hypothetical protein
MDLTALFPVANSIRLHHHVPYHFPSFTIGLAAWLTVLEALGLATGRAAISAPDATRWARVTHAVVDRNRKSKKSVRPGVDAGLPARIRPAISDYPKNIFRRARASVLDFVNTWGSAAVPGSRAYH